MRDLRYASLALWALLAAGPVAAAEDERIYAQPCAMLCHNVMPPKLGDKKAWVPRL